MNIINDINNNEGKESVTKMRNRKRIAAVGLVISSIGVLLSIIDMLTTGFSSMTNSFWTSFIVFCATIAIFTSLMKKEKEHNDE